jgi:hypothetical protein
MIKNTHAPCFQYFRQPINFPLIYRGTKPSFFPGFQEFSHPLTIIASQVSVPTAALV